MANKSGISRLGYLLMGLVVCCLAAVLIWQAVTRLEGEPPVFGLETPVESIGAAYNLRAEASDRKSGLKRIWIAIIQDGREVVLLDETFPAEGFLGRGAVKKQPVSVDINMDQLGLKDGQALLRVAVWDYSCRAWLAGNRTYAEHRVMIDTRPPDIELISRNHNLNQGGSGLAIYRILEPVPKNGVQVANSFFPGSRGHFSDTDLYAAFFALPYEEAADAQIYVTATDQAGNTSRTGIVHHVNTRSFSKDVINIPDSFLKRKMPEFENALGERSLSMSLLEKFLAVNSDLRRANYETIRDVCRQSDAQLHWTGPFLRLPASARKAGFADHRTYKYQGRPVDTQVHLGIDLASTAHSPVPAANSGRVVFAENLGIYGKTVIMDHGFTIFSMYGHLSRIHVTKDQVVSKGDVIGFTGSTGLAGGDHLHFSMLIHHTFVNPIEWWDRNWIKHNITDKLEAAKHQADASIREVRS